VHPPQVRAWASTGALSNASILRLMSMIVSLSLTSWSVSVRLVNVCTLSRIPLRSLHCSFPKWESFIDTVYNGPILFDDGRDVSAINSNHCTHVFE